MVFIVVCSLWLVMMFLVNFDLCRIYYVTFMLWMMRCYSCSGFLSHQKCLQRKLYYDAVVCLIFFCRTFRLLRRISTLPISVRKIHVWNNQLALNRPNSIGLEMSKFIFSIVLSNSKMTPLNSQLMTFGFRFKSCGISSH